MKIPRHPTPLRRSLESRIRQYAARGPVLAASLVQIAKHCGREGCRCQSGPKHVGHYITFAVAGKTHTVYVPKDLIQEVQAWIQEHKRMKLLGQEISQLSIARIRRYVQDRRKRQGRP
jgi:hypothetical protein